MASACDLVVKRSFVFVGAPKTRNPTLEAPRLLNIIHVGSRSKEMCPFSKDMKNQKLRLGGTEDPKCPPRAIS